MYAILAKLLTNFLSGRVDGVRGLLLLVFVCEFGTRSPLQRMPQLRGVCKLCHEDCTIAVTQQRPVIVTQPCPVLWNTILRDETCSLYER